MQKNYNDNFKYTPEKIPNSNWRICETNNTILKQRRQELNLTQNEVAHKADIDVRQYQRLESGERDISNASMSIGLKICKILALDPYRFER